MIQPNRHSALLLEAVSQPGLSPFTQRKRYCFRPAKGGSGACCLVVKLLVIVCLSAFPIVMGCGDRDSAESKTKMNEVSTSVPNGSGAAIGTPKDKKPASQTPSAEPEVLFKGWPEPAVAILVTGEQFGYLEPCGCSANQDGGIARRDNLIQKIKDRKWKTTALDLGGMIKRNRDQTHLKFQTSLNAMRDMGYQVLGLGPEELRLGADRILSLHTVDPDDPASNLTFVCANVILYQTRKIDAAPKQFKIIDIDGFKIGVTAILGSTLKRRVLPEGKDTVEITIEDPKAVLPDVLKSLKQQQPDLLVLLSHATFEESKRLAARFPDFNLVISAGGPEHPLADNPIQIGKTMLATAGHKGTYAGVVGVYPDDQKQPLRFELVKLDAKRFQDSPRMIEHMRVYQDMLRDQEIAVNEATNLAIAHSNGANYVGAEKCGECHTKAFEIWKKTPHANAYESLITGREEVKDRWVSRIYDPECLSCHVTGWHPQDVVPYKTGFVSKKATPHLLGNQCENCHGPGSEHVRLIDDGNEAKAKPLMRVTLQQAKDKLCYTCHDLDNDPHFGAETFQEYWEKIVHPGLD